MKLESMNEAALVKLFGQRDILPQNKNTEILNELIRRQYDKEDYLNVINNTKNTEYLDVLIAMTEEHLNNPILKNSKRLAESIENTHSLIFRNHLSKMDEDVLKKYYRFIAELDISKLELLPVKTLIKYCKMEVYMKFDDQLNLGFISSNVVGGIVRKPAVIPNGGQTCPRLLSSMRADEFRCVFKQYETYTYEEQNRILAFGLKYYPSEVMERYPYECFKVAVKEEIHGVNLFEMLKNSLMQTPCHIENMGVLLAEVKDWFFGLPSDTINDSSYEMLMKLLEKDALYLQSRNRMQALESDLKKVLSVWDTMSYHQLSEKNQQYNFYNIESSNTSILYTSAGIARMTGFGDNLKNFKSRMKVINSIHKRLRLYGVLDENLNFKPRQPLLTGGVADWEKFCENVNLLYSKLTKVIYDVRSNTDSNTDMGSVILELKLANGNLDCHELLECYREDKHVLRSNPMLREKTMSMILGIMDFSGKDFMDFINVAYFHPSDLNMFDERVYEKIKKEHPLYQEVSTIYEGVENAEKYIFDFMVQIRKWID